MKKHFSLFILLIFCMLFSACGKEKEQGDGGDIRENVEGDKQENYDDINIDKPVSIDLSKALLYYEDNPASLFCLDEDGTVYTYDREGKRIYEYNTEGKCVKKYPIEAEHIQTMCYQGERLYYIVDDKLYAMDLAAGISETLYIFDGDTYWFRQMLGAGDSLFILRKQQYDEKLEDVRFDEDDEYVYEGEELLRYSCTDGKMEKINISNIKQIAKKSSKELLVYAYDGEKGFYFADCDAEGKIGKKQYTQMLLGVVQDIAYDSLLEQLVCTDVEGVFFARQKKLSDKSYVFTEQPAGAATLLCQDGFTYGLFYLDGAKRLIRMENSLLTNEVPALKAYTLNNTYLPQYYGYTIDYEQVLAEEMAMILLAADSDYDFLVLDSAHDLAGNIRRTGAYYPLGDLAGMEELLADCHAYVREAATAPNGNLWMLPLEMECPVLLYNEEGMKKNGAEMAQMNTYTKFIDWVVGLPKDDDACLYSVPYYLMTNNILYQYLGNYAIQDKKSDFHTDVFHTYMDIMRKYDARVNAEEIIFDTERYADTTNQDEYYSKILFSMLRSSMLRKGDAYHYAEYDYFHAAPVPMLEEKKFKNQAEAWMIVVNPNSKKLKWVLTYLEEVCKGIRADKNSFMLQTNDFSDRPLWQEVHGIIADAEVYFAYPEEIIADELYRYRMEGQSYEDTVNEMERKMNMYLNE